MSARDNAPEPDFPECVHCGNQSGPLTPTGDRWPSGAQKFECVDDCREKANPEPTGRDTELLRKVAAMLRDESARRPERLLVNKGLHIGAQLVDRMANQASAPSGESTPDFFQAAHTYQRRRWLFRCLAVSPNPFNGEVRAVGFLYRPGEPATATALDPDDWSHGDWTNTTNDTTTGDPA